MNKKVFAIIEIGSNNTKTHIYEDGKVIYENNTTIEFKKNYQIESKINEGDLNKLFIIKRRTFRSLKSFYNDRNNVCQSRQGVWK